MVFMADRILKRIDAGGCLLTAGRARISAVSSASQIKYLKLRFVLSRGVRPIQDAWRFTIIRAGSIVGRVGASADRFKPVNKPVRSRSAARGCISFEEQLDVGVL